MRTVWLQFIDAARGAAMLGVFLAHFVGMAGRLALGAAIYSASWIALLLWEPTALGARLAKETPFGTTRGANFYTGSFPLLPWFGVYLAATAFPLLRLPSTPWWPVLFLIAALFLGGFAPCGTECI